MESWILINDVYGNLLKALVELKASIELSWVNLLKALVELKPLVELRKRDSGESLCVHTWK